MKKIADQKMKRLHRRHRKQETWVLNLKNLWPCFDKNIFVNVKEIWWLGFREKDREYEDKRVEEF